MGKECASWPKNENKSQLQSFFFNFRVFAVEPAFCMKSNLSALHRSKYFVFVLEVQGEIIFSLCASIGRFEQDKHASRIYFRHDAKTNRA